MRLFEFNQITPAERNSVGEKAFRLAQMKQGGFPVVEGWVIPSEVWLEVLPPVLALNPLEVWPSFGEKTAQALDQGMDRLGMDLALNELCEQIRSPWIVVRASLALPQPQAAWELQGMLSAYWGPNQPQCLRQGIQQIWETALRARCQVIWRHYCQGMQQVRLAILVQPAYAAVASGSVMLRGEQLSMAAVTGLGMALTWGEATPVRCQTMLSQVAAANWQVGQQEVTYALPVMPTDRQLIREKRSQLDLHLPLSPPQVQQLVRMAERLQAQLGAAVRLEWLQGVTATGSSQLFITQVDAGAEVAPAPAPQPVTRPAPPRLPINLPAVTVMVRGIGASAGQVLAPAVVVTDSLSALPPVTGAIVVLSDLQPDRFTQLQGVAGIVTERGGATCHAAILARELGIPAVVGAPQATQLLQTGDFVWLEGQQGLVYVLPEPAGPTELPPLPPSPARPQPTPRLVTDTRVMVNLSQVNRLSALNPEQSDGVGLLRSEWLLLDILEQQHPQGWIEQGQGPELQHRIVQQLEPILAAFAPQPVRYRSLDLRSHEWTALSGSPAPEANPMLGIRGTFSYQMDSRLFEVELAALAQLQQAGYTNLQLILPFVRTVEEFVACRRQVIQAGLTSVPSFQLWIMAEVPSVLFLLPAFVQAGVQGIAIGTNDLTQLLLAVDRDQPALASSYDERHPAVVAALNHLITMAHQQNIPCSICGQAPVRHPELIERLVQWGISSISVEASALEATRQAVAAAEGK